MTRVFLAAIMACGAAGAAQAQTYILDEIQTIPGVSGDVSFSVSGTNSLYEGVVFFAPSASDSGSFDLYSGSTEDSANLINAFTVTSSSPDPDGQILSIGPGTYNIAYDFTGVSGSAVLTNATATAIASAPEIDPSSAMAGLTLLGFGATLLRGRGSKRDA
jgi:hypothetical protein